MPNSRRAVRWVASVLALGVVVVAVGSFLRRDKKPAAPPRNIASRAASPTPATRPTEAVVDTSPTSQSFVPGDAYVPAVPVSVSPSGALPAVAEPRHVSFVSGGKLLVAYADGRLEFRDVVTGQRQAVGAALGAVRTMSTSPDGRMLACVDPSGAVNLIETTAYGRTNALSPGVAGVNAIALSPDGRGIALAGGGVVVWDIADRKARTKLLGNERCSGVAFSGDGKVLAVATAGGVSLWETTFWQKQATLPGGGAALVKSWPARAAVVATGAGVVRLYDLATRQLLATLSGAGEITDVAPSPDGRTIVTCGGGGVIVWDSATRAAHKLP